jgi:tRNA pseudouridine38-40 synthase
MDRASQNWKLTLAYDGGDFQGWQVQPGCATVQGTLAEALEKVTGERILPQGSGRTDAGVHAIGQVTSFHLFAAIPPANLQRALNRTLPASIRVMRAEPAPPDFHARHSTRGKTYEYRLYRGALCPPTIARFVHATPWKLDIDAMRAAARIVVGEHDFTSFVASDPELDLLRSNPSSEPRNKVRRINLSEWEDRACDGGEGGLLVYRVHGNGFLHHMVRNLVGTFIDVGRGRFAPDAVRDILAARARSAAGPTAPPHGLFLISVDYEDTPA